MAFKNLKKSSLICSGIILVFCISSSSCFFNFLLPEHARYQAELLLRQYPNLLRDVQNNLMQQQQQQFNRNPFLTQGFNRDLPMSNGFQNGFDNRLSKSFDQALPRPDKNGDNANDELVYNNEDKARSTS